jgi:hypothetical protein
MNQHVSIAAFTMMPEEPPPSPEYRVRLVEAGAFVCKYIIGEADENAVCCGAPTDGKSWCSWHRKRVFEPRKPGRLR